MKVILFGCGHYYNLYKRCFFCHDVIAIADNNKNKQDTEVDGIKVISPENIIYFDFDKLFLLVSSIYEESIKNQLNSLGVKKEKIASLYDIRKYCEDVGEMRNLQIYTDTFGVERQKKCVAIFHPAFGISTNGVDVCLLQLCRVLKKYFDVHVIIHKDSYLREILLNDSVTVVIDEFLHVKKLDDIYWLKLYDFIFVNSADMFNLLQGIETEIDIPIIWWLHSIGADIAHIPLARLKEIPHGNVHVYAVSPLTEKVFCKLLPSWNVNRLIYGIEERTINSNIYRNTDNMVFAIVGRCTKGKGQDILVDAVLMLSDEVLSKCEFWIVGNADKSKMYVQNIMEKTKSYPVVRFLGVLYNDELTNMYRQIDVLVCPSRADAMPIVCAEAMMHSHPCIVSENVGTKFLIEDKENGLICKTEDPAALKDKIEWCVNNKDKVVQMGKKARIVYENNFTMRKFEENIMTIIKGLGIYNSYGE